MRVYIPAGARALSPRAGILRARRSAAITVIVTSCPYWLTDPLGRFSPLGVHLWFDAGRDRPQPIEERWLALVDRHADSDWQLPAGQAVLGHRRKRGNLP